MGISQQIGASSIIRSGVCTSTTRPASPYVGQGIYETDTLLTKYWDGSNWLLVNTGYVICTSTTKPSTPFEGQMIYCTDTDTLELWNGSAWRIMGLSTPSAGTVLQTVSTQYSTTFVNNTNTYLDMGLTLNITTKSATSKVLILATIPTYKDATSTQNASGLRVLRNGTVVKTTSLINYTDSSVQIRTVFTDNHLDSPATLGTLTYKYQLGNYANSAAVVTCSNSQPATLTLMEIAG